MKNLLLIAAVLFAGTACQKNDKTGKEADHQADRVNENAKDLREESREVAEVSNDRLDDLRKQAADKAKDTAEDVKDLSEDAADRIRAHAKQTRDDVAEVAEEAREDREDVRDTARANAKDVADESKDVGKQALDLEDAQNEFEYARMVRIATLRGVQSVAASQTALINAFAATPQEREKLQIFQMRVDEAGNQIQALQGVPATTWEQRHDDVKKAMSRLEDAREDAWEALDDADRLDRTSMR